MLAECSAPPASSLQPLHDNPRHQQERARLAVYALADGVNALEAPGIAPPHAELAEPEACAKYDTPVRALYIVVTVKFAGLARQTETHRRTRVHHGRHRFSVQLQLDQDRNVDVIELGRGG